MSSFRGLYDIRPGNENDKNFILATFLRGLYYGESHYSLIPKQVFMDNYKIVAENILNNSKNIVMVACLKEDPNVILGYSILSADPVTIHWVYVKSIWRNKGIAKSLLPADPTAVTHLSKLGLSLMTKFKDIVFNPFLTNK